MAARKKPANGKKPANSKAKRVQVKDLEAKKDTRGGDGNWGSALTFKPSRPTGYIGETEKN